MFSQPRYMIWAYQKPEGVFSPATALKMVWVVTIDPPGIFQLNNPGLVVTVIHRLSRREHREISRRLKNKEKSK